MSKLSPANKFLDFSDYGRPFAKLIVSSLINTKVTPIQLTLAFGVSGLMAVYCIFKGYFLLAGVFLILKSVLDAADGEMARQKNTPSYVGRYLDSIFDIILNLILLLLIGYLSQSLLWLTLFAFICVQMQGTLYNYYYVILRNISVDGDQTSKVFEQKAPKAFNGEQQINVNIVFYIFKILYIFFDRTIQALDSNAHRSKKYPNWFMSLVSIYGLGSQLLLIALFLAFGKMTLIIPFFIGYTALLPFIILLRKTLK